MVDYDTAVAAVQDPDADPILLAKIAYENPEFGANVAVNPRCYPGLKRWLAEFGDARARETLAQLGITADSIGGPVQNRPDIEREEAGRSAANSAAAAANAAAGAASSVANAAAKSSESSAANAADSAANAAVSSAIPSTNSPTNEFQPHREAQSPAAKEPVPTNPYGFTVQQALTTTDQMTIAQIAQYAPELRACIARNPNTYPALLDWLRQLGDPDIDAALASRR